MVRNQLEKFGAPNTQNDNRSQYLVGWSWGNERFNYSNCVRSSFDVFSPIYCQNISKQEHIHQGDKQDSTNIEQIVCQTV